MPGRVSKRVWGVLWGAVPLVWAALVWGGGDPSGPRPAAADPHHPVHPAPSSLVSSQVSQSGRSPFRGPAHPRLLWSYPTGGPITGQVVVDGQGRLYVGSHDGYLYALDPEGRLRFRRRLAPVASDPTRARIWGTPWVDAEDRVYVGSDAGVFASFDAAGALRFRIVLPGPIDRAPTPLPGGRLVVAAGKVLTTLSTSGQVLGTYVARSKLFTRPVVDAAGRVFIGGQDDRLHALDAAGSPRFLFQAGADIDSRPALGADGAVYFGADDGRVRALDAAGRLRWATFLGGYVRAPLALGSRGDVIAATLGPRPQVVSLCGRHGVVRWTFAMEPTDSAERGVVSGPLVDVRGDVYVGSHDGGLYALSAGGAHRFRFLTGGEIRSAPTLLEDGTLVFGSDDGNVYALRDTP